MTTWTCPSSNSPQCTNYPVDVLAKFFFNILRINSTFSALSCKLNFLNFFVPSLELAKKGGPQCGFSWNHVFILFSTFVYRRVADPREFDGITNSKRRTTITKRATKMLSRIPIDTQSVEKFCEYKMKSFVHGGKFFSTVDESYMF